jgi:hypothetical protein
MAEILTNGNIACGDLTTKPMCDDCPLRDLAAGQIGARIVTMAFMPIQQSVSGFMDINSLPLAIQNGLSKSGEPLVAGRDFCVHAARFVAEAAHSGYVEDADAVVLMRYLVDNGVGKQASINQPRE